MTQRLAPTAPKVAALLTEAEENLLAFYRFQAAPWPKLRSTNNLERVNKEIARRSDVVGIFPNDSSVIRLVGALLIEQNDEWLLTRGYLSKESIDWSSRTRSTRTEARWRPWNDEGIAGESRYTTTRDLTLDRVGGGDLACRSDRQGELACQRAQAAGSSTPRLMRIRFRQVSACGG